MELVRLTSGLLQSRKSFRRSWKDIHIVHTKSMFKAKTDVDGAIERFKARLVACGNEQLFGVDYGLTFAAVMEMSTVTVILVFARR